MGQELPRMILTSNNAINGNINWRGIACSIAQQVNICPTKLLNLRQPGKSPIVLQLLLPVRLLRYPVCHCGVDEAWRYTVDPDSVLRPFHCQGMCHIPYTSFRCAIGCWWDSLKGWSKPQFHRSLMNGTLVYLVWSVRSHWCSEDDSSLDIQLNESSGSHSRTVERSE